MLCLSLNQLLGCEWLLRPLLYWDTTDLVGGSPLSWGLCWKALSSQSCLWLPWPSLNFMTPPQQSARPLRPPPGLWRVRWLEADVGSDCCEEEKEETVYAHLLYYCNISSIIFVMTNKSISLISVWLFCVFPKIQHVLKGDKECVDNLQGLLLMYTVKTA